MKEPWPTVATEKPNKETTVGRIVVGSYGRDYELDEDGNEVKKPRIVRGRGRPKLGSDEPQFSFPDELQDISLRWNSQKNQEVE